MPNTMIKKQFISSDIKVNDEERTVTAVISTSGVDRDREVIKAKGGDFANYLKNPVVLFAHDYRELPIAKATWIKVKAGKIVAEAKFADTEMAEDVYQLYKGGFLSAFSIGFIPQKRHAPSPKEIEARPELANVWSIIDEWELLEFSAVPVPSNPQALATAVKTKELKLSDDTLKELEIEADDDDAEEKTYLANETADSKEKETDKGEITVELDVKEVPKAVEIPVKIGTIKVTENVDIQAEIEEAKKKRKGIVY